MLSGGISETKCMFKFGLLFPKPFEVIFACSYLDSSPWVLLSWLDREYVTINSSSLLLWAALPYIPPPDPLLHHPGPCYGFYSGTGPSSQGLRHLHHLLVSSSALASHTEPCLSQSLGQGLLI